MIIGWVRRVQQHGVRLLVARGRKDIVVANHAHDNEVRISREDRTNRVLEQAGQAADENAHRHA